MCSPQSRKLRVSMEFAGENTEHMNINHNYFTRKCSGYFAELVIGTKSSPSIEKQRFKYPDESMKTKTATKTTLIKLNM